MTIHTNASRYYKGPKHYLFKHTKNIAILTRLGYNYVVCIADAVCKCGSGHYPLPREVTSFTGWYPHLSLNSRNYFTIFFQIMQPPKPLCSSPHAGELKNLHS